MYIKRHVSTPSLTPAPLGQSCLKASPCPEDDADRYYPTEGGDGDINGLEDEKPVKHSASSVQQRRKGAEALEGRGMSNVASSAANITGGLISTGGKSSSHAPQVLFKDAHRVHPKQSRPGTAPTSSGTSAFKVS